MRALLPKGSYRGQAFQKMRKAQGFEYVGAGYATSLWRSGADTLGSCDATPCGAIIDQDHVLRILPDLNLWDIWPVQHDDGSLAPVADGDLWVMLSAPRTDDSDDRHGLARMRLLHRVGKEWRDCGDLLPDGFSPGSREWSGSTRLDPDTGAVTLWFTAAGRRGEAQPDFEQRLFKASAHLDLSRDRPRMMGWHGLAPSVDNDGAQYADLSTNQGEPGMIKGFRDPYWFRDPATGLGYLLFTASKSAAMSRSRYDGVVGIAAASDANGVAPFELLPPLIDADGQANEMERPHALVHRGLYYLFWSTQRHVFAPGGLEGPTGLYGMVAPALFGPWEPLNGSGLVLANPPAEPRQAYAWQVIPGTLEVISFIDHWGLEGRDIDRDPALKAARFGGTVAPMITIALDGNRSWVVEGGS
jgi:levansucrase